MLLAIPAGFEVSTYHIFNELSPPPLQHPHSLGHIHHTLALDLLTQETSSTEDPTPAGSVPVEEGKGSFICSGMAGGRAEPQRCPTRPPHSQDDLGHTSHTQQGSTGKPPSLSLAEFISTHAPEMELSPVSLTQPDLCPALCHGCSSRRHHSPAGDKDVSILALPMVCLHLPQQADEGVRVGGKVLLHGPVCQLM